MSEEEYDILASAAGNHLHWFCDECKPVALDNSTRRSDDKIMVMLENLTKQVQEISNRLNDKTDNTKVLPLEEKIKAMEIVLEEVSTRKDSLDKERSVVPSLKAIDNCSLSKLMSEAVANQSDEEKEVESRKNNIIIYRILESNAEDKDTRAACDRSFITALFEGPLETGPINEKISNTIRLGRRQEGAASRPLLVKFEDEMSKAKVMGNLRKLKSAEDKFKKVSVAHDLTPKQREAVKSALRMAQEEANAVGNIEEKGNFKIRVVGHLHKPKAIRIKTVQ
jgi:hypothetical protein